MFTRPKESATKLIGSCFKRFDSSGITREFKFAQYYKMSHDLQSSLEDQQYDTFFGTEVINRVSFLRDSSEFMQRSINHASARFLFFKNHNPLFYKGTERKLVVLANGDDQHDPHNLILTNKGLKSNELWTDSINKWVEANNKVDPTLRDEGKPVVLFMGIEDGSVGLDISKLKSDGKSEKDEKFYNHENRYQGIPFYAVDVTNAPALEKLVMDHIKSSKDIEEEFLFFTHSRKHFFAFSNREAALYSHAKMFFDWIDKNRFCPGCGSKVIPINGGGKLKCTNKGKRPDDKPECPVQNQSVSNVSFPRTDAVIITSIMNTERTKVLLSLSKRFANSKMYACTAGFMEPSETVEVATKREIWEETGVVCSKIDILRTQPWPFPGNLMIGCIGTVEFNGVNEVIHLGHDRELADARWFSIEFIRSLVYSTYSADENPEGIMLPPPESIAYSLIKYVVDESTQNVKL